jgi:dihydrodipicolinate synthase/N-acetylneuraminate lyase|tara:strand:- start:1285 stop:1437 length:153 start_codon:yes stop_codon:yes gene_type:complete
MKEVAVLLERLPRAVVRPPLCKLGHREIEVLERAIKEADIGPLGAGRRAA